MSRARQTFVNRTARPIYISVEVNPECYKLEPEDRLTLIYKVPWRGDALQVDFVNAEELVIWPNGAEPTVLINGESAAGRSWNFEQPD